MNNSADFDNRDIVEMNKYLEARIEALTRRVKELEALLWSPKVERTTGDHNGHLGAVEHG